MDRDIENNYQDDRLKPKPNKMYTEYQIDVIL